MTQSNFDKSLEMLSAEVKKYREMKVMDGTQLNTILQQIVGILFYLESEKTKFHDMYQLCVQRFMKEDKYSHAKAENEALVSVPQLYQLRKICEAGGRVADAIRSNLAWLKNERNNSNNQPS